jgi:hypothetical protein
MHSCGKYSDERLKLAQLLGQLGVFLTPARVLALASTVVLRSFGAVQNAGAASVRETACVITGMLAGESVGTLTYVDGTDDRHGVIR